MSRRSRNILIDDKLPVNSANTDFLYNETDRKLYFRNRSAKTWEPLQYDSGSETTPTPTPGSGNTSNQVSYSLVVSASNNAALVALGYANSASSHVNILAFGYANSASTLSLQFINSASNNLSALAFEYASSASANVNTRALGYATSASAHVLNSIISASTNPGATYLLKTSSELNPSIVTTDSPAVVPLSVRAFESQTANIQEWQDSSASPISWISASGVLFSVGNEVATNSYVNSELLKKVNYETPVNTQSGTSYTFSLDDARRITTTTSASAKILTILPQASASWLDNTILRVINFGQGSLSIAGGNSVSVSASTTTFGPNEGGSIIRTGSNSWTVVSGGGGGFANFSNSPTGTYIENNVTYKYVTYTGNGSLVVTKAGFLDVFLVGGGGGSSADGNNRIGGGGAGGIRYGAFLVPAGTYTVTIGGGGGGAVNFAGTGGTTSISSVLSVGGGSGGNSGFVSQINSAGGGGSGGGFFFDANQSGGGTSFGGGAGGSGTTGLSSSYTGSPVTYGVGGTTGGGTANRGNGGSAGATGGSGIVIVRTRS
jgi:hypothetical protein